MVLVPSTVFAVPQFPMQFYGEATFAGTTAPDGTEIEVKINGIVYGTTTVKDGKYGYDPVFLVPADDPDTSEVEGGIEDDIIEFYIGDALAATASFVSGGAPTESFGLPVIQAVTNVVKTSEDTDNTPTFTWDPLPSTAAEVASYEVMIDDGDWENIGNVTTFTVADTDAIADGSHTFKIRAVDNLAKKSASASLTFIVDTTAPTTPGNVTRTTADDDTTPTFTWDAATDTTSGVASYQVRIDSGDFSDIGNATTFTVADADALSAGSHTFEVKAVDAAGNTGSSGSLDFEITGESTGGVTDESTDGDGSSILWIILGPVLGGLAVAAGIVYFLRRSHIKKSSS